VFLSRVIDRSISLTDAQRSALKAVDADVFRKKRGGSASSNTKKVATKPHQPYSSAPKVSKASPRSPPVKSDPPKEVPFSISAPEPVISTAAASKPIRVLSKDDSLARLVTYHQSNGQWPSLSYKDHETGFPLGLFFGRVIDRSISLTDAQRSLLRGVDVNVFGKGGGGGGGTVTGAVFAQSFARKRVVESFAAASVQEHHDNPSIAKKEKVEDDVVERLLKYYKSKGKWPSAKYKDPETGAPLGLFLRHVMGRSVSLTKRQLSALGAVDPNLLDERESHLPHTSGAHLPMRRISKDEKVAHLLEYYRNNGHWPSPTYKCPETGSPLVSPTVVVVEFLTLID